MEGNPRTAIRKDGATIPTPEWADVEEANKRYRDVLRRYVASVNAGDAESVTALFADDAVVEDPYGGTRHNIVGRAAIEEFYRFVVAKTRMEILLITGSGGAAAAMAIRARVGGDVVQNISVAKFDAADRITRYTTFWGPGDRRPSVS